MINNYHRFLVRFAPLSLLSGVCTALLFSCAVHAAGIDNELKAAYIARFTEFIEWPSEEGGSDVFMICVFGDHPIQSLLEELPRLISIDERPLDIIRIEEPERAGSCEILFVPDSENGHIPQIHQYTRNKPVLVINEIPDVPAHGQLISLYKDGDRLRIQIHLREAQAAGFIISSRLLKLANIVE